MGREIKFKPTTFYLGIADHLARVAEAQAQGEGRGAQAQEDAQEQKGAQRRDGRAQGRLTEGASTSTAAPSVSASEREEIRQEGERVEMAESLSKGDVDEGGREERDEERGQGGTESSSRQGRTNDHKPKPAPGGSTRRPIR